MSRKDDSDLQRTSLNLFKGDYEKLQTLFPDVGAAFVIRHAIRKMIERVENETTTEQPTVDTKR